MEGYRRLTPIDRYQIEALKESGLSVRAIAGIVERSPSSVSRELQRNSTDGLYRARRAQRLTQERRHAVGPPRRIDEQLARRIKNHLISKQLSPEQIHAHFLHKKIKVSIETIYKFIYDEHRAGGNLYLNLRRHRKHRLTRSAGRNYKKSGLRVNQSWISERPKIVEAREGIGDYERDTLLGKKGSPILLTIVDRVSRFTRIAKIKGVNAQAAHNATVKLLKKLKVHTITNDNGAEFAFHKKTAEVLKTKIYFNDPYCSWQRGTNENTNGLIRQYFPKGYDFKSVSNQEIKRIQHILNTRPRKCLGFKTPLEVEKSKSRVLR